MEETEPSEIPTQMVLSDESRGFSPGGIGDNTVGLFWVHSIYAKVLAALSASLPRTLSERRILCQALCSTLGIKMREG